MGCEMSFLTPKKFTRESKPGSPFPILAGAELMFVPIPMTIAMQTGNIKLLVSCLCILIASVAIIAYFHWPKKRRCQNENAKII